MPVSLVRMDTEERGNADESWQHASRRGAREAKAALAGREHADDRLPQPEDQ